jgi:DNA replication factor GINS
LYAELYAAWARETENTELQALATDFYVRVSEYLKSIKEKAEPSNKKLVEQDLLGQEARNVRHIIRELLRVRYRKLLVAINIGEKLPTSLLTIEEVDVFNGMLPFSEAYRSFARRLMLGETAKSGETTTQKLAILRFLKEIPAIIGSDMKSYGPYNAEDVASLPVENAKLLVKQGLAEIVQVS